MKTEQTGQERERGKMTAKGVLMTIGIVASGVLVTIGVVEIRFRVMKRALLTEVQTLQENNQELQTKNDKLTQETKALRAQVRTLQEKNQELQAKNDELTKQIESLKTELGTKIRIVPNR